MGSFTLRTSARTELVDVTDRVRAALPETGGRSAAVVFCPHTTAGLVLQAAGDGARFVASDLAGALDRLVDESGPWRHTEEGDRNPWSHVRSALTASSLVIPLADGDLGLGRLQAVFLCEFDGPRDRTITVTAI